MKKDKTLASPFIKITGNTMEENNFFKWLWRLNGLVLFIALIGASVVIAFEAYQKYTRRPQLYQQKVVVNVADDPKGDEQWILGRSVNLRGNNMVILPLVSKSKKANVRHRPNINTEESLVSANHRRRVDKNLLFINTLTNESFWLFKGFDRLILHTEPFYNTNNQHRLTKKTKAIALFFRIVTQDTNNDKLLTMDDKPSLAVVNPDGSHYRVIIEQFDNIITKTVVEEDKILIIYQNAGVGYSLQLQLNTFEVLSKNKLPKVTE